MVLLELPSELLAVVLCFAKCEMAFVVCVCRRLKDMATSRRCNVEDAFKSAACVQWAMKHPVFALLARPTNRWTPAAMHAAASWGDESAIQLVFPYWQDGSKLAVSILARHNRADLLARQLTSESETGRKLRMYFGQGPVDSEIVGGLVGSLIQPALVNGAERVIQFVVEQMERPGKQEWWNTVLRLMRRHSLLVAMCNCAAMSEKACIMLDAVSKLCAAACKDSMHSMENIKLQMAAHVVTSGCIVHGNALEWAKELAPNMQQLITKACSGDDCSIMFSRIVPFADHVDESTFLQHTVSAYEFVVREIQRGGWMHEEWAVVGKPCYHYAMVSESIDNLNVYRDPSAFSSPLKQDVVDVATSVMVDCFLISYPNGHSEWQTLLTTFRLLLGESARAAFEVLCRVNMSNPSLFKRMHAENVVLGVLRAIVYLGRFKIAKTLLHEMDVSFTKQQLSRMVATCAEVGCNEILEMLIEAGGSATRAEACVAAHNGHSAILRSLLVKYPMLKSDDIGEAALSSKDIDTITAAYNAGCFGSNRGDLQMRATFFLAHCAQSTTRPARRLPLSLRSGLSEFYEYPPRF
jgi:hypothetical protein